MSFIPRLEGFRCFFRNISGDFILSAITGWQSATLHSTSDPTIDVITSTTGVTHTFVWDSASDIPSSIQPTVIFRITAIDDGGLSSEKLTDTFSVDNR